MPSISVLQTDPVSFLLKSTSMSDPSRGNLPARARREDQDAVGELLKGNN